MSDWASEWPLAASAPDLSTATATTFGDSQNIVTIGMGIDYYAFLDQVEETPIAQFGAGNGGSADSGWEPGSLDRWNVPGSDPETLGLGRETAFLGDVPGRVMLHFQCVRREYFNEWADGVFKPFYAQRRGEDIDSPHDLTSPYWEDGRDGLVETHKGYLTRFLTLSAPDFRSVYVWLDNSADNWRRLRGFFATEGWFGLRVSEFDYRGLRAQTYFADEETSDATPSWVTAAYQVSPLRINHLQHVFSLDFAPDAFFPGLLPDEPIFEAEEETRGMTRAEYRKKSEDARKRLLKVPIKGGVGKPKHKMRTGGARHVRFGVNNRLQFVPAVH